MVSLHAHLERLKLAGPNSALHPGIRLQPHHLNSEAANRRGIARGRQQRCRRAQEAQAEVTFGVPASTQSRAEVSLVPGYAVLQLAARSRTNRS